jgi:hypothetical protein
MLAQNQTQKPQPEKSENARKSEGAQKSGKTEAKKAGALKLVDLNTATEAELRQIPGVDAELAKKIIANRPYVSEQDLARSGLPVEVERNVRMRVTVSPRTQGGTANREDSSDTKPAAPESDKKDAGGKPDRSNQRHKDKK